MKRLQFRHHEGVFESRSLALAFFEDIVNTEKIASQDFGTSLYAEPMVAKYLDENRKEQVIFAIGVDSGNTAYHLIDSAKLTEDIVANKEAIEAEVERATQKENDLSDAIKAEEERATEVEENLQQQISDNIANVKKCSHDLDANVLEEYVLQNAKGEELGEHIKIYKDSALVDAQMTYSGATGVTLNADTNEYVLHYDDKNLDKEHEVLYLIYKDAENALKLVSIDFEKFVLEAEFKDGLVVKEGTHSVYLRLNENAVEQYLKVDENGLRIEGINEAIEASSNGVLEEAKVYADEKKEEAIATASAFTEARIADEHKCHTDADAEVLANAKQYTDEAENKLQKQIDDNKVYSKDIEVKITESGTQLTYFADENTITKENAVKYEDGLPRLTSLLTIAEVTPTEATVKAQYELRGRDGVTIGEPIKITKESALSRVEMGNVGDKIDSTNGTYVEEGSGNDTLNFIYLTSDGTYELIGIEISKYFTDAHFGRGFNNQDGVVSLEEGDGNEYLVIGEDTISVIGVNDAIRAAKEAAIAETEAYTDTEASKLKDAFTEQVNVATGAISTLTDTLNSSISNVKDILNNETSAREAADADIIGKIQTEDANREAADTEIRNALQTEIENRQTSDTALEGKIDAENTRATEKENALSAAIVAEENRAKVKENEIETNANTAIDSVSSATNTLVNAIKEQIATAEGVKVVDVTYGKDATRPTYIQLKLADGTFTDGFDASDFLVDSVLTSVELENDSLVFIWNTDDNTKISIPLNKFTDVYTSGDENYLKVNGTVISAVVDGDGGLVKTLASTEYADNAAKAVDAKVDSTKTELDAKINEVKSSADTKIDELKASVESATGDTSALDKKVESLSGGVTTEISVIKASLEGADTKIATQVSANTKAIEALNADSLTVGSVSYIANDKIAHAIVTDGTITEQQAELKHSLARMVDGFSGNTKYYISSNAADMWYTTSDGTEVPLNQYINSLESKINDLQTQLTQFNNDLPSKVKEIIDGYVTGTEYEIGVKKDSDKLVIGFADNAIFGGEE
jgi:hypothetical protein